MLHYDLFAISKLLPTVPRIRLSCIFCDEGRWLLVNLFKQMPHTFIIMGDALVMGDVGNNSNYFSFNGLTLNLPYWTKSLSTAQTVVRLNLSIIVKEVALV